MPDTTAQPVDIDYDCEFATTDPVIGLVSIALADSSTGATYYAINAACDRAALLANPWLMDNVVPTLPLTRGTDGTSDLLLWDPDLPDFDKVKSRAQIAAEIRDFVLGPDPDNARPVRLWADYGAYDHVALCQLFGTMTDLPTGFPMWTHDLRQEIERLGLTEADLPQQQDGQHNALADALHQQNVRRHIAAVAELQAGPARWVLGINLETPTPLAGRFRKKPVEIEARQWDGTAEGATAATYEPVRKADTGGYSAPTEAKLGRPLTEAQPQRGGEG